MTDDTKLEIALMKQDVSHIKDDIQGIKKTLEKLDNRFVKIERYAWIEKIVIGVSMAVLIGSNYFDFKVGVAMKYLRPYQEKLVSLYFGGISLWNI